MRISDWSSDVCSSDLDRTPRNAQKFLLRPRQPLHIDEDETQIGEQRGVAHRAERRQHALAIDQPGLILGLRTGDVDIPGAEQKIGRASCRERVWQYR